MKYQLSITRYKVEDSEDIPFHEIIEGNSLVEILSKLSLFIALTGHKDMNELHREVKSLKYLLASRNINEDDIPF